MPGGTEQSKDEEQSVQDGPGWGEDQGRAGMDIGLAATVDGRRGDYSKGKGVAVQAGEGPEGVTNPPPTKKTCKASRVTPFLKWLLLILLGSHHYLL